MTYPLTYTPEPKKPSGGPRAGTRRLYDFCIGTFDVAVHPADDIKGLGIYNPRDVCGNPWPEWTCTGSQHARGAAGDCGVPVVRPQGHAEGHRLAGWLVTHHAALGVQEVIWAGRRWHNRLGVIPHAEWPKYGGRSDHFDHVHWAQNDAGADGLTDAQIKAAWAAEEEPDMQSDERQALFDIRYLLVTPYSEAITEIRGNVQNIAGAVDGADPVVVDVDEAQVAEILLRTLTPEAIAKALGDGQAKAVADELAKRLAG